MDDPLLASLSGWVVHSSLAPLTLLLPWAHICAFGQIQVLAEFETSVFDEVYVKFSRIYMIGKQFFMILQST